MLYSYTEELQGKHTEDLHRGLDMYGLLWDDYKVFVPGELSEFHNCLILIGRLE